MKKRMYFILLDPMFICIGMIPAHEAVRRWKATPQATFVDALISLTLGFGATLDLLRRLLFPFFCRKHGAPSFDQLNQAFTEARTSNAAVSNAPYEPELVVLDTVFGTLALVLEGRLPPADAVRILLSIPQDLYVRALMCATTQVASVLDLIEGFGFPLPQRPSKDRITFEFEQEHAAQIPLISNYSRNRRRQKTDADRIYEEEMDKGGSE
jgi:hypothetical protein